MANRMPKQELFGPAYATEEDGNQPPRVWTAPHATEFCMRRSLLPFLLLLIISVISFLPPAMAKDAAAPASFFVNLQDLPVYLKRGFEPRDTRAPDLEDASWMKKSSLSAVIVRRTDLPGLPERRFLSPFARPEEEFTFALPFFLDSPAGVSERALPGLFLAGIGDNWEVYLNGTLVRSEMHLASDSLRIMTHRSQRSVFFPFSGALLRPGENLLTFRLVGDPTDKSLGFQYATPYYMADYDDIKRRNSETLEMILIGGYLLIALYHFLLFASRRKDSHNFFCGLFSFLMGLYYLFRTHGIYQYIPDTMLVVKLEFFCIFLVIPALGAFAEILCSGKISSVTKIYSAFFAFLAFSQLALPRPYGSDALVLWQVTAIAALVYLLIAGILLPFLREVQRGGKEASLRGSPGPGLAWFFAETYAGNLLIAVSVIVVSAIADILDSLYFHHSLNLTHYSLFVFVLTVTLMLARIYGRLNNALQAKNAFLANMSHDIRTPLNAIMGTAERLLRETPDKAARTAAGRIRQAGGVLTSIIDDILDLSRLEADRLEIVRREYRFAPFMEEITGLIAPELARKGIAFRLEIDPAIPPVLVGDAAKIRRILLNLLTNAVKFTGRGEVALCAAWQDEASGGTKLVCTVADTGPGIAREDLPGIFTEFYQLGRPRPRNGEGTGLGLSICKKLCTLMGGEIRVRSECGKGSAFTFVLPQEPGSGDALREHTGDAPLLEQGIIFPSARVLIVDDLACNRRVLAGLLKPYGMRLHAAPSGVKALEMAALHAYDLVFMDHVMDGHMDGVAAARALRELKDHAATPVVALTANAMKGMREFFLERGFQDYISKPVDPAALDAVIARLLPEGKREQKKAGQGRITANAARAAAMPVFVRDGVERQRLDLLRHYCRHFTNEDPEDAACAEDFSMLLESFDRPDLPHDLRARLTCLASAARRFDVPEIRRNLPPLYAELAARLDADPGKAPAPESGTGVRPLLFTEALARLQEALDRGDARNVEAAMNDLRAAPWAESPDNAARELYFFLYDTLMLDKNERAAGALGLWRRLFGSGA